MSETTEEGRPAWVRVYLDHRAAYARTHPRPRATCSPHSAFERYDARREIVPLALTIADLTEQEPPVEGVYCAWSDPTGQDETYEEAHGTFWSARAAGEAVAPVLASLRNVESLLDEIDAVTIEPEDAERQFREHDPDTALRLIAHKLTSRRHDALLRHGFTFGVREYLAYRHLSLPKGRVLYVKPSTPWSRAGVALCEALDDYASAVPERFETAAARIIGHRRERAKGLPPEHWGW